MFGAAILWVVVSIIIGIVAAATRDSWLDKLLMALGLLGISMPVYWLGEVMNLITQSRYHDSWAFSWVPPLGYKNFSDDPKGWFLTLVIPWITLAILYIGIYGRVLRAAIIESMQEDFIRTARAKGLSETRILLRHALRTSLIAFVTLFGLDFGALVGGSALLTEVVFGLHGIGKLTYDALQNLDLPMIMATVMYASMFVVIANAVVDFVYHPSRSAPEDIMILSVRDLKVSFRTDARPGAGHRWRLLRPRGERDPRRRRRIRFGQDGVAAGGDGSHHRSQRHHRRLDPLQGPRTGGSARARTARVCAATRSP